MCSDKRHVRTHPPIYHPIPAFREYAEVERVLFASPTNRAPASIPPIRVSRDWGAIFRESSRVLYEEVDYTREGKNAERFSNNFEGTEWIKAPSINWSRSTGKVRRCGKREAARVQRQRRCLCFFAALAAIQGWLAHPKACREPVAMVSGQRLPYRAFTIFRMYYCRTHGHDNPP